MRQRGMSSRRTAAVVVPVRACVELTACVAASTASVRAAARAAWLHARGKRAMRGSGLRKPGGSRARGGDSNAHFKTPPASDLERGQPIPQPWPRQCQCQLFQASSSDFPLADGTERGESERGSRAVRQTGSVGHMPVVAGQEHTAAIRRC
eukprot:134875-Chlamydomonas_euryale.AAC.6